MNRAFESAVTIFANLIYLGLLVYVLMGYFGRKDHPIYQRIGAIVEPILERIRTIFPPNNGLDFSPLVLFLLIWFMERLVYRVF